MADFTPGPWTTRFMTSSYEWTVSNKAGEAVAWVDRVTPPDAGEANARLIAAAPDLLAALKTLVGHQSYDTLLKANKAIARAEGRE